MRISPCSNCGGNNLYRSDPVDGGGAGGPDFLPGLGTYWAYAKLDVVVCRDCGLTRFFASREATEKVAGSKKWKHME